MAPRDPSTLGGPRCQAPATHDTIHGRRCAPCAEILRASLRDPHTLGNVLAGGRARTEEEIALMVVAIPPEPDLVPSSRMSRRTLLAVAAYVAVIPVSLVFSCVGLRSCPPTPGPADASTADASVAEAGTQSTAVVINGTLASTTVYASFGANSKVGPANWSFCGDEGGCAFPLLPGASQLLPTLGQPLNVTLAFGQAPGCGTSLAELNVNISGWSEDTANISLVNGWNADLSIGVSDAATLGPTRGPDANADVFGVYPVACDVCVARSGPPCGYSAAGCTTAGSCGCKGGTQYDPTVPCQASFARGATVTVTLVGP